MPENYLDSPGRFAITRVDFLNKSTWWPQFSHLDHDKPSLHLADLCYAKRIMPPNFSWRPVPTKFDLYTSRRPSEPNRNNHTLLSSLPLTTLLGLSTFGCGGRTWSCGNDTRSTGRRYGGPSFASRCRFDIIESFVLLKISHRIMVMNRVIIPWRHFWPSS